MMKKGTALFYLFLLSVLFASCGYEQKAKRLIREEFKETLNDYKSYEPVSYSELLPLYKPEVEAKEATMTPEQKLKSAQNDYASWVQLSEDYKKEFGEDSQKYKESLDIIALLKERLQEAEQESSSVAEQGIVPKAEEKPREVIGWVLEHKYRARIPAGGYKLFITQFVFDKDMTMVVSTKDLTD